VTHDASIGKFLDLMRIPTLRATIFSQTLLFFVLASNAYWLPLVLTRRFNLSVSKADLLAGVVLVAGGLLGTLVGGWIGDRRALKNPAAHLQVGIAGFLLGAVFITIALVAPMKLGPVPLFVPAFFLAVVSLYLYSGPFTALSQSVVSPSLRASAETMLLFVSHVVAVQRGFILSMFGDGKVTAAHDGRYNVLLLGGGGVASGGRPAPRVMAPSLRPAGRGS